MIKDPRFGLVLLFLLFFTVLRSQETIIRVPFSQPKELIADAGENQSISVGQTITVGTDASITGGSPEYLYAWKDEGGNEYSTPTLTISDPGVYYLIVTDEKHCTARDSLLISQVTVIENANWVSGFSLFPNPSNGIFYFKLENHLNPVNLEVVSAEGRIVFKQEIKPGHSDFTGKIDLTGFDRGVYYVKLTCIGNSLIRSILIQ